MILQRQLKIRQGSENSPALEITIPIDWARFNGIKKG
jgi:hypothetical protein